MMCYIPPAPRIPLSRKVKDLACAAFWLAVGVAALGWLLPNYFGALPLVQALLAQ